MGWLVTVGVEGDYLPDMYSYDEYDEALDAARELTGYLVDTGYTVKTVGPKGEYYAVLSPPWASAYTPHTIVAVERPQAFW